MVSKLAIRRGVGVSDMSWEHAAEARAALNAIVTDPQHGVAALSSAQTMSNLLKDLLPDAPREKSILVAAAEAGLADTLRQYVGQGMDPDTAIRLTSSSFSATTPFTAEACSWVTGEIATALGMSHGPVAGSGDAGAPWSPPGFGQAGQQGMPTQAAQSPGGYAPSPPPAQDQGAGGAATQQTRPGQWRQPGQQGAQQPGFGGQPGGYGGQPGSPGGYGQPGGGGYGQPGVPGGWPAQPGAPAGYAQPGAPGGWPPGGGYGPVPGGPAPRRSSRRWLLVGGGLAVVAAVAIVIGVSLSGNPKPSPSHSPKPHNSTPVVSSTSPLATPSPTYPHPRGTDALTAILNPPTGTPVGTGCVIAKKFNMDANQMDARLFCPKTTRNNVVVWAYQFKGFGEYRKQLDLINTYVGFDKGTPGSTCPPPSGYIEGRTGWHANHNPKYISRPGQTIECLTDGNKPVLIWTMPTQDAFFIGQNNTTGTSIHSLLNWWKTLTYGP